MREAPALAITFDFGQTLAWLDADLLAERLGERGLAGDPGRLDEALPAAWRVYDEAIRRGLGGHPWKVFMRSLLEHAGVAGDDAALAGAVDFLWDQQPARNLWRRPIPGMLALVDVLRAARVPVGIVSNSEGRLAELVAELGWEDRFVCVADSGKLGLVKPDPAIFGWAAERLGVPLARVVHVGDSYEADIAGALAAGMRGAVWFGGDPARVTDERVRAASDAAEVRAALAALSVRAG